jgi:chemotaxis protein MotA
MDFLTIVGLIGGISAILLGQTLEGGHVGSIMQLTAAIIVLGGTLGAVLVNYPLSVVMTTLKNIVMVIKEPRDNPVEYINQIVGFATLSRKEGLLALEQKVKTIEDPFFRKGLQLVVDGTEPKLIREIMEIEMSIEEERLSTAAKPLESAGGYAPTIGIIGAVLGLIHVMENLADPSKLGAGIATAFVATVYGVGSANLIFLPLAGKLKLKIKHVTVTKELILEGLISIATGENPRHIQEKLEGFLTEAQRKGMEKK